jgi:hypothetical protein
VRELASIAPSTRTTTNTAMAMQTRASIPSKVGLPAVFSLSARREADVNCHGGRNVYLAVALVSGGSRVSAES